MNASSLVLYDKTLPSRLLLGTAAYPDQDVLRRAIAAARPAMITVALRRQNAGKRGGGRAFYELLRDLDIPVLPNTAGCRSVQEAVATAEMARELFQTERIKLELIGDDDTLQPDVFRLVEAADVLIKKGFEVLPYCNEDLIACRRLLDVGCRALMPWAAPIGSALGVVHEYALRLLRERLPDTPLIVDAGLGLPSQAAQVMEWGYDGVLLNSAVAHSGDPVLMAEAFALAVDAGRKAFAAEPVAPRNSARATTAVVGQPFWHSPEY